MKTLCLQGNVLTKPFLTNDIKVKVNGGFATISQKYTLTPLEVVIGSEKIKAGSIIHVSSDACKQVWATKVYTINGVEGILVPESFALAVTVNE